MENMFRKLSTQRLGWIVMKSKQKSGHAKAVCLKSELLKEIVNIWMT